MPHVPAYPWWPLWSECVTLTLLFQGVLVFWGSVCSCLHVHVSCVLVLCPCTVCVLGCVTSPSLSLHSCVSPSPGAIQSFAGFADYFTAMAQEGWFPLLCVGLRPQWEDHHLQDLQDSYGQEWVSTHFLLPTPGTIVDSSARVSATPTLPVWLLGDFFSPLLAPPSASEAPRER